jgi:hypothetical protein
MSVHPEALYNAVLKERTDRIPDASIWIPAFAGMTSERSGNDERAERE